MQVYIEGVHIGLYGLIVNVLPEIEPNHMCGINKTTSNKFNNGVFNENPHLDHGGYKEKHHKKRRSAQRVVYCHKLVHSTQPLILVHQLETPRRRTFACV